MHATYTFIINDDDLADDAETSEARFRRLAESFDAVYGEEVCDENNWYEVYGAVTRDGTLLGTDEFVRRWAEEFPDPAERFEAARRFAAGCVALDMRLFDARRISLPGLPESEGERKLSELETTDDVTEAIYETVPRRLSEAYAKFDRTSRDEVLNMEGYRRAKLAAEFERFHQSRYKPFADHGTPYEYRAFDLRNEGHGQEPTDEDVILLVDIHT